MDKSVLDVDWDETITVGQEKFIRVGNCVYIVTYDDMDM